jgi:threonine synthase
MQYFSTNGQSPKASFKEATIKGQAPDKGLYFPEMIPLLPEEFFETISNYSNEEIAYRVIQPFVGDEIPDDILRKIVNETINFDIPLVKISDAISSLELFHGPTLAFKDVGARFMSRCLGYFVKEEKQKVIVLVATSGDTGGAVANGFYNVDGVEVVILYPSGKVSSVQEKQLTTLGNNIHALEVDGTFDDCQQMVKQAFTDEELNKKLFLTSANSINVDVGNPSNFVRIMELFHQQIADLKKVISSVSITDAQTKETIKTVYETHRYLLDPHGAVGYHALEQYLEKYSEQKGFILETAHPVKFYDVVEPVIGETIPVPPSIQAELKKEKKSQKIKADGDILKEVLYTI